MKTTKYLTLTLFTLIGLLLPACTGGTDKRVDTEEVEVLPEDVVELREDQIKLANVTTGSIELLSLSGLLKANGVLAVAPQDLATVCAPLGGSVKSTHLQLGQRVKKGQTLAQIENPAFIDLQQAYLEAKNTYEVTKAEYERQRDLFTNEVGSQKSVQQITADYKTVSVTVKALEQKLSLLGINPAQLTENTLSRTVPLVAPIDGFVKTVQLNVGKTVSPTDVLVELVNCDRMYVDLTLFDQDANPIVLGQKVQFFLNSETEAHEAVIHQTGKTINDDKTYHVYANVVKPCSQMIPGMYVNALIKLSGKKATAVPTESIVRFDDKDYLFIVEKNKVENGKNFTEYRMIPVKKGQTENGYTEITLPVTVDYTRVQLVVKGAYNLLSAKKNAGEMSC